MTRARLLFLSILLASCGGSSSPSDGPATTPPPGGSGGGETGAASDDAYPTSSGDSGRVSRATIDRQLLDTCTAEAISLLDAHEIEVQLGDTLGPCTFETPPLEEQATVGFDVFSDVSYVRPHLQCPSGVVPELEIAHHTYAMLTSTYSPEEHWEVVFAVEDGDHRAHVGARLVRPCEGALGTRAQHLQAMVIEGGGRGVTLHRCRPVRASECASQ